MNKKTFANTAPQPFTGTNRQLCLAGQLFNSPTALTKRLRLLKDSQPLNQPFAGTDDSLLREWVTYHPDAASKIGAGVDHFFVKEHREYGSLCRGIYIQQLGGAVVDIGYKEPSNALVQLFETGSLRRNPSDLFRDFKGALRLVVDPQCLAVKKRVFSNANQLTCPVTGRPFTFTEADTDHVFPMTFDAIAWHWSMIWGIRPQEVELIDRGTSFQLADSDLAASFAGFHLETANLRVISRAANNSAARFPTKWNLL